MHLHPSVELIPGLVVTAEAWKNHGELLKNGCKDHRIIVIAFPIEDDGTTGIRVNFKPIGEPAAPSPPNQTPPESTTDWKH